MVERFRLGVSIALTLFGIAVTSSADPSRSLGNVHMALGMTIILGAICVYLRRSYIGKIAWLMGIVFFLGRAFCVGPLEEGVWTVVCREGEFRWVQSSPFAVKSLHDETLQVGKCGFALIYRTLPSDRARQASFLVYWSVTEQDLRRYVAADGGKRTVEARLEALFPTHVGDEELAAFKRRCLAVGVSVNGIYREL